VNALELGRGAYDARRAAALAGVPVTTLHYWARTGLYIPSVCPEPHTRLWAWGDLIALRAIDFFRRGLASSRLKAVSIPRIRQAVRALEDRGYAREELPQVLAASSSGELFIVEQGDVAMRADPSAQSPLPNMLNLVRPYATGPDLRTPRPRLRILPGKLQGEPHVSNTRIPTAAIYALERSGYQVDQILRFYPEVSSEDVDQALDLERSLNPRAA
jgi:uncharacterized protein (DUF433 family)/DNA-binding transcriptional MerR regulator